MQTEPRTNVSKQADADFMTALASEDPKRYARLICNIRKDNPSVDMDESQALTNFMLGLPTGQWRFRIVAGVPAPVPHPLTDEVKTETCRKAGRPKGSKDRSYIRRSNQVYASAAERQRAYRERKSLMS